MKGASHAERASDPRAAVRVDPSGHCYLNAKAVAILGYPRGALIAARDGELIIRAATNEDHRAYLLTYYPTPTGGRSGGRLNAKNAVRRAGLLQDVSIKYAALECEDETGRAALFVHSDVQLAFTRRAPNVPQEVAE